MTSAEVETVRLYIKAHYPEGQVQVTAQLCTHRRSAKQRRAMPVAVVLPKNEWKVCLTLHLLCQPRLQQTLSQVGNSLWRLKQALEAWQVFFLSEAQIESFPLPSWFSFGEEEEEMASVCL